LLGTGDADLILRFEHMLCGDPYIVIIRQDFADQLLQGWIPIARLHGTRWFFQDRTPMAMRLKSGKEIQDIRRQRYDKFLTTLPAFGR